MFSIIRSTESKRKTGLCHKPDKDMAGSVIAHGGKDPVHGTAEHEGEVFGHMGLFAAENAAAQLLHFQPVILGRENRFFFRISVHGHSIGKIAFLIEANVGAKGPLQAVDMETVQPPELIMPPELPPLPPELIMPPELPPLPPELAEPILRTRFVPLSSSE